MTKSHSEIAYEQYEQAEQIKKICPDIAKHIARACEQAYRRGYQQGATFASDKLDEVVEWRFDDFPEDFDHYNQPAQERYDQATPPPGVEYEMPVNRRSALYRLQCESGNVSEFMTHLCK